MALLDVRDLSVSIGHGADSVAALSGVSLHVDAGEVVGLVGESGGGKSMTARSVIGMLPDAALATGQVLLDGADVLTMTPAALHRHRGGGAAMCFQNPRSALSPVRTVGRQLTDRLAAHQGLRRAAAKAKALELFDQVGIRNPAKRFGAYPHELSGGMCQRVMIALSLACAPRLVLADEPTTGLDVTLTREILALFRAAASDDGRGVLLISHDLASISEVCDRIVVLYAGTVVESGPSSQLLARPAHPYSHALVRSVPDLDGRPIVATAGTMPLLREEPAACPFAPRCVAADETCRTKRPPLADHADGWNIACFHPLGGRDAVAAVNPFGAAELAPLPAHAVADPAGSAATSAAPRPAVDVRGVDVEFASRFGTGRHRALRDVSLEIARGEVVGIVGESGCGKSTLARVIAGLQPVAAGSVQLGGTDLASMPRSERRQLFRRVQMVFQDPQGALSPRRTVLDALTEPLRAINGDGATLSRDEQRRRALTAIEETGLDASILDRKPSQLSGGQAQRVGVARALIVDPDVVVLDEPTSALDVTVQAQVLELIKGLGAQRTRSFVFISHDLATVRGFCDRVVVLYLGRVVEEAPADVLFERPLHPYTRALLSSAPRLRGETSIVPVPLARDIEQAEATAGCPLIPRCPYAVDACREPQSLRSYAPAHRAACHRIGELTSVAIGAPVTSAVTVSGRTPLSNSTTSRAEGTES